MYINSEKELEDYICNNIDNFIKDVKKSVWKYKYKNIKFVGRQVRIGGQIADLVFYYDSFEEPIENIRYLVRNFIVVELKFRICETKDLAQLTKYLNLFDSLNDKYYENENSMEIRTEGILLGFDLDNNLQEIEMQLKNTHIHFMNLIQNISFQNVSYSLKESYIKEMQVDDRIFILCKGGELIGEKEDDRPKLLDG